jgi:hypothetical protein
MSELERMFAEVWPPDERVVAEGRRRLLATAAVSVRRRRLPVGWRIAIAAGLAVALAAGVIVVRQTDRGSPVTPRRIENVSVVQLMHRAATAARSEPELHLRDDQYLYVKSRTAWGPGAFHPGRPKGQEIREVWLSVNGAKPGILRSPCRKDLARTCTIRLDNGDAPEKQPTPALGTYRWTLQSVPRLFRYWRTDFASKHPRQPVGDGAWADMSDLLGENYLPPALRAKVFDFLAEIPGTTVTKNAVDGLGRPGIAVSKTIYGLREDFVFDPSTYRFLGTRESYLGPPSHITDWRRQPPGSDFDMAFTVLATKAVDHAPTP